MVYGLNMVQFQDNMTALKSVKNDATFSPDIRSLIDIDMLSSISLLASAMPHPLISKT